MGELTFEEAIAAFKKEAADREGRRSKIREKLILETMDFLEIELKLIGPNPTPDERIEEAMQLAVEWGHIPTKDELERLGGNSRAKRGPRQSSTLVWYLRQHIDRLVREEGLCKYRAETSAEYSAIDILAISLMRVAKTYGGISAMKTIGGSPFRLPQSYDAIKKRVDKN